MSNSSKKPIDDDRITAYGFLIYSGDFYKSYKIITTDEPDFHKLFPVKYYLLSHSIELVLKAYLRKDGMLVTDIRNLGHDLVKIAKKVDIVLNKSDRGLSELAHNIIEILNLHYPRKDFEYHRVGSMHTPHLDELGLVAKDLIEMAEKDIKPVNPFLVIK